MLAGTFARLWEGAAVALRRHGPRGAAARAMRILRRRVRTHADYVWYELDLGWARPEPALPDGFALRPATDRDLAEIGELPEATSAPAMRRLRAAGHEPWVVERGGRVAFICWIYRERAPVAGVGGGWIDLPPEVVCLEGSLTVPAFRGQGIAGGAWRAVAAGLAGEGVRALVTKVDERNGRSRAALAKAGFRAVAAMTLDRSWGRSRVAVRPAGDGIGPLLARLIAGRPGTDTDA
jgi:RimJ/RimL family protein N-acetyltransferase